MTKNIFFFQMSDSFGFKIFSHFPQVIDIYTWLEVPRVWNSFDIELRGLLKTVIVIKNL